MPHLQQVDSPHNISHHNVFNSSLIPDYLINHKFDEFKRVHEQISKFPTTRYYGSKKRITSWIYDNLKNLQFTTVLDAFGGTASVSLVFKAMGKMVTYNDALNFNTISANALVPDTSALAINNINIKKLLESIEPCNGFITKQFKGLYYTSEENSWLDGFIEKIKQLNNHNERCIYLHCLFQSCLQKRPFNLFHRANLNLRLNTKVNKSFGNQTTWDTQFPELCDKIFCEIKRSSWVSGNKHEILTPGDVNELPAGFDLVYLDPPYVGEQDNSDDYLKRYHFLEGISEYEKWHSRINYKSKNLSFSPVDHIRNWQHKTKCKDLLFNLISCHRKSIVVLSYTDNGYPTKDEIYKHFSGLFTEIRLLSRVAQNTLSKCKRNELLFIGVP